MSYRQTIETLLSETADIARSHFSHVTMLEKAGDNNQVLTQADLDIGKHIISHLTKHYPDHTIIDEETGVIDHKSPYVWIVDPIDGTSNFAAGLPMYGIMIGLLENAIPIAGGIVLPSFGDLFIAEKGHGAYKNGQRIYVTTETDVHKCLVTYTLDSYPQDSEQTKRECDTLARIVPHIRNLRVSNCCYDMMMVATGVYGAWINQTSRIWDNVAPHVIIEEAGGLYTDITGIPVDYTDPVKKAVDNFTVCAASPSLHKRLQSLIHS